jgi:hypothetical protein
MNLFIYQPSLDDHYFDVASKLYLKRARNWHFLDVEKHLQTKFIEKLILHYNAILISDLSEKMLNSHVLANVE